MGTYKKFIMVMHSICPRYQDVEPSIYPIGFLYYHLVEICLRCFNVWTYQVGHSNCQNHHTFAFIGALNSKCAIPPTELAGSWHQGSSGDLALTVEAAESKFYCKYLYFYHLPQYWYSIIPCSVEGTIAVNSLQSGSHCPVHNLQRLKLCNFPKSPFHNV